MSDITPALVSIAGGVVTAWLRHRGKVRELEIERERLREQVASQAATIAHLQKAVLDLEREIARGDGE